MPRRTDTRELRGLTLFGGFVAASVALLLAFAPNRRHAPQGATLALSAPLPDTVPPGVTLTVGDPVSRWVFRRNGWDKALPFKLNWAEITGGPEVTEAFHAHALDAGLGVGAPPVHAVWVGLPVKIIAVRERADPAADPAYVLGVAPKGGVEQIADLRGKRIAFSPSQIQGAIVLQTLKTAGLTREDVKLVELPSSIGGDVYTSSLASNVVDVAPLGAGIIAAKYLREFGPAGARAVRHPAFRDDAVDLFVPVSVLQDPGKAAALKVFVHYWGMAQAWQQSHRGELAQGYYVKERGLTPEDARLVVRAEGDIVVPGDWREVIAGQQAIIDLMAPEAGHPRFSADTLFDPRFEHLAADAAAAGAMSAGMPSRIGKAARS